MNTIQKLIDKFTEIPITGMDVSESGVCIAETGLSGKRPVLRFARRMACSDHQSPSSVVESLMHEQGMKRRHFAVGLASAELIVRPFRFKNLSGKELQNAVRMEAEAAILNGHRPEQMAIDWHALESGDPALTRGIVAVVPKEILRHQTQNLSKAGSEPTIVDVKGLCLWNAYWALQGKPEGSKKTVMLVNLTAAETNLVIARSGDDLILVRDLLCGLRALAEGRQEEWLEEVRDSIVYARSQGGMRSLDEIYVTGAAEADLPLEMIRSYFKYPVKIWNPFDHLEITDPSVDPQNGPYFSVSVGLSLRKAK